MKTEKLNYKGYQLRIIGNIPTGQGMTKAIDHIKSLSTLKGCFKMQVIENGLGAISTINFKTL